MIVLEASPDIDASDLAAFWQLVWRSTYVGQIGPAATEEMCLALRRDGAARLLPGNGEVLSVARHEGALVGTLIARWRGRTCYVWGVYVHSDWQRRGLGSALMEKVLGEAQGDAEFEVRVLHASEPAQAFYRRFGFVARGEEDFEISASRSEPATILTLRLGAVADRGPLPETAGNPGPEGR